MWLSILIPTQYAIEKKPFDNQSEGFFLTGYTLPLWCAFRLIIARLTPYMINLRKLIWYFYRPIFIWNMAFTLMCIGLIAIYGLKVNSFVFLFKLMGYAAGTFLRSESAKQVYMYYRNAGYSVRRMYTYVYLIDFGIYGLLLTFWLILRP